MPNFVTAACSLWSPYRFPHSPVHSIYHPCTVTDPTVTRALQESRHQAMNSETERLRRLRERVEAQELKLRKLRALRGQSEQQRVNNNALSEYPEKRDSRG